MEDKIMDRTDEDRATFTFVATVHGHSNSAGRPGGWVRVTLASVTMLDGWFPFGGEYGDDQSAAVEAAVATVAQRLLDAMERERMRQDES